MLDFLIVSTRSQKRGNIEIYPKFVVRNNKDLMIRGGDFYAIWNESTSLWSNSEDIAISLIDKELDDYKGTHFKDSPDVKVLHLWDSSTGMIDSWHHYCQKQCRDNFHALDEKLIFSNSELKKTDYASKILPYNLESCPITNWENLMNVLYSEEELRKIEWAIGAVVSGDSKKIQKFLVFYGAAGTGKSTVLNVIQKLFDGYYCVFDSKALGSSNASFALEPFKANPLVAIQHDGDLSKIEDNTRINSLVSHEMMTVNEKFHSAYPMKFKCFLFMGTNKPVRITDAKSGLIRRLIDVEPTGNQMPVRKYKQAVEGIKFELGGIAQHCLYVYQSDPEMYDNYIPIKMIGASNDFYNFVEDSYDVFKRDDMTTLKASWEMYKVYSDNANLAYPLAMRAFKEELKNYFYEFSERSTLPDGSRVCNLYKGFKIHLGGDNSNNIQDKDANSISDWLVFDDAQNGSSFFDTMCKDYPAQYANKDGTPIKKWADVTTTLSNINTAKLHYVMVPENHIVIDFDIPDENGNKSFERNYEAASKWPQTYAEVSKSGQGIHLHYIYNGDVNKLSRIYDDHIEIKIFNGNSSLRRLLTKFNKLMISVISSGLPLKGDQKMLNFDSVKSERSLRVLIERNLKKEIHSATKPSVDFIKKILDEAYDSDLKYDVSDMRNAVLAFASSSTNHATECVKIVSQIHFLSKEASLGTESNTENNIIVFFDCEVFPNLFIVNYKKEGEGSTIVRLINPKPIDIEKLCQFWLVGFNCRKYDNHMLYACMQGYNSEQIYKLSRNIIDNHQGFFGEAYNISYTDIYDYVGLKDKSLKKWEIELGILHQELGLPWDKPVPKELWEKVASYCDNDVTATEAVWNATQGKFTARKILADLANGSVNDTTNTLTTKIIFGNDRHPQSQFNYRFLGDKPTGKSFTWKEAVDYALGKTEKPEGKVWFPGYTYDVIDLTPDQITQDDLELLGLKRVPSKPIHKRISMYRDEMIGEGGYVHAAPGMYGLAETKDSSSHHPHSEFAEKYFGETYSNRYEEIYNVRACIKHHDYETARKMLDGKLAKYLNDESTANDLSAALKIAINSVYGLTAARFDNPFKDPLNVDNFIAKRGALTMVDIRHAVEDLGYTVIHCKTDSIKIANPTPEILNFVVKMGEAYGYIFETEETWDRICLVNHSVFIGKNTAGKWIATGTQFQVPYVYKTLFSGEPITFDDLCETRASKSGDMYINTGTPEDPCYNFVGKIGRFCPIKPGCGGGELVVKRDENKYDYVSGSKGYYWLESEMVKKLGKEGCIDKSYYIKEADDALMTLNIYGDADMFRSDDPYPYIPEYITDPNFSPFPIPMYPDSVPFLGSTIVKQK